MIKFIWDRIKGSLVVFIVIFVLLFVVLPYFVPSIPRPDNDVLFFSILILIALAVIVVDSIVDYNRKDDKG
jgi:hypothetical protein